MLPGHLRLMQFTKAVSCEASGLALFPSCHDVEAIHVRNGELIDVDVAMAVGECSKLFDEGSVFAFRRWPNFGRYAVMFGVAAVMVIRCLRRRIRRSGGRRRPILRPAPNGDNSAASIPSFCALWRYFSQASRMLWIGQSHRFLPFLRSSNSLLRESSA